MHTRQSELYTKWTAIRYILWHNIKFYEKFVDFVEYKYLLLMREMVQNTGPDPRGLEALCLLLSQEYSLIQSPMDDFEPFSKKEQYINVLYTKLKIFLEPKNCIIFVPNLLWVALQSQSGYIMPDTTIWPHCKNTQLVQIIICTAIAHCTGCMSTAAKKYCLKQTN